MCSVQKSDEAFKPIGLNKIDIFFDGLDVPSFRVGVVYGHHDAEVVGLPNLLFCDLVYCDGDALQVKFMNESKAGV